MSFKFNQDIKQRFPGPLVCFKLLAEILVLRWVLYIWNASLKCLNLKWKFTDFFIFVKFVQAPFPMSEKVTLENHAGASLWLQSAFRARWIYTKVVAVIWHIISGLSIYFWWINDGDAKKGQFKADKQDKEWPLVQLSLRKRENCLERDMRISDAKNRKQQIK